MSTVPKIRVYFLFLYFLFPSLSYAESEFTIDDIIKYQTSIGTTVHHKNGRIYFEQTRPLISAPRYKPYGSSMIMNDATKVLMSMDTMGHSPPMPMFQQDGDSAYLLAHPVATSPGGDFIGVLRLTGWTVTPGVFDTETRAVRFFDDLKIYSHYKSPTFLWLSEDEILVVSKLDEAHRDLAIDLRFHGPLQQTDARRAAWRQDRSTASQLGSGKYFNEGNSSTDRALVIVDVKTAEQKLVHAALDLGIETLFLSPTKRFVLASRRIPDTEESYSVGYDLIDFENDTVVTLSNDYDIEWGPISWSPSADKLAFYLRNEAEVEGHGPSTIVVLDARTSSTTEFVIDDAARSKGTATDVRRISPRRKRVTWLSDAVLTLPVHYAAKGRTDWVAINVFNREVTNLTSAFDTAPDQPVAKSADGELLFLSDGDLFLICEYGDYRKISSAIAPLSIKRFHRYGIGLESTPRMAGVLPGIQDLTFVSTNENGSTYFHYDEEGQLISYHRMASAHTDVHAASKNGVVYSNHVPGHASKFLFSDSGEQKEYVKTKELFAYNKHLDGTSVSPPPIRIEYEGVAGERLFGWLHLPVGSSVSEVEEFPLVVVAHAETIYGGGLSEITEGPWEISGSAPISMQLFTSAGYAVLLPSIPLNWSPSDPMSDMIDPILSSLAAAIETRRVDEDRIALTGHSFGGYTALSVAVQTDSFDAIIAAASTSNLASAYGSFKPQERFGGRNRSSSPINRQHRMGGEPWEDALRYMRNSPVFFADRVTTPLMMIHGDLDFVPIAQAEEMFTALNALNKDVIFLRYWGEAHTVLQPQNQRDMWGRVFDFLEDNGVTPGPKTVH